MPRWETNGVFFALIRLHSALKKSKAYRRGLQKAWRPQAQVEIAFVALIFVFEWLPVMKAARSPWIFTSR